ncbi:MAG: ABC transporter ATP-binding protein [Pseudomonadota bacterium]
MTDQLSAQNLAIERGGRRVVAGVSASLEPGTLTAICGPNGAGKSSLLLALAGLLPPAQGTVQIGDESVVTLNPKSRARAIGYLPQGNDIAWDVSVESLAALGRHPHGDARHVGGNEAVAKALAATNLQDFTHRRVSQLSGGEKARALLARVLAGEPQWILADEPLAALDLSHQLGLIAHLKVCAESGQGVVIVLHDLGLAMNHADRALVLKEGALIADGPPQEALSSRVIEQGWGVRSDWLGEAGARALVTKGHSAQG